MIAEMNPNQIHNINIPSDDIGEIIKSAVETSGHQNPIIVINNKQEMIVPADQNQGTLDQHQTTSSDENSISIKDIDHLISVIDKIQDIYTNFYEEMPNQPNAKSSDFKSGTLELRLFILRLKKFTKYVIMESYELMNNINLYEKKIHLMKSGEAEMMVFFNYGQRYSKLKTESVNLSNKTANNHWDAISYQS